MTMIARQTTIWVAILLVILPLGMILYQSVLSAPFFMPEAKLTLGAFSFVLTDPEFWVALRRSLVVAVGMVVIAVPLGAILGFLFARTDMPGRRILEPFMLIPMLVPSVVLGFGYTVSVGPTGFMSEWIKGVLGFVPWNIYTTTA